jgi:import inner membrane translocase subunit TIM16
LFSAPPYQNYKKYFDSNDPAKGGSFYLQSKIYRAHAALLTELGEDGDDKKEGSSEGSGDKEGQTDSEKKDESK